MHSQWSKQGEGLSHSPTDRGEIFLVFRTDMEDEREQAGDQALTLNSPRLLVCDMNCMRIMAAERPRLQRCGPPGINSDGVTGQDWLERRSFS